MKSKLDLKQWTRWLDDHLLLILSSFLLVFIPLYPKLPLFSPIEQYIVRVRVEDFLILITVIVWIIQAVRKKIDWKPPVVTAVGLYLVAGLLSVLSAVLVIGTVPFELLHLGKTLLHYFRYIEYFTLLFIVFSAIKTKQHVKVLLLTLTIALMGAAVYGFGQKYYYWPVYSTMNREFSKGVRLYLTEHARVQSTFAGHYDLGAYLVIVLPIMLALAFRAKKKSLQVFFHVVHWLGLWLLVVSAARSSFLGYVLGVVVVIALMALQQPTLIQKTRWAVSRLLVMGVVIGYTFFTFGDSIYERFLQLLQAYPELHQQYHSLNASRKEFVENTFEQFLLHQVVELPQAEVPENALSTEQAAKIILESDTRPTPVRPADVYKDIPDRVEVATTAADGTQTTIIVEKDRTFSDNAIKYGLSLAIRLDTLWPQAMQGFQRNPLVGSGYATLNKESPSHFTEADSTDNNFLRTLGETGLFGFVTFYGIVVMMMWIAIQSLRAKEYLLVTYSIGYLAATAGLLLNAIYIDVFASSKVAYTFWSVSGLLLAFYTLSKSGSKKDQKTRPKKHQKATTSKSKK